MQRIRFEFGAPRALRINDDSGRAPPAPRRAGEPPRRRAVAPATTRFRQLSAMRLEGRVHLSSERTITMGGKIKQRS
jgi:hypothetical protein